MAEVRKVACWMPSKLLRRHGIVAEGALLGVIDEAGLVYFVRMEEGK